MAGERGQEPIIGVEIYLLALGADEYEVEEDGDRECAGQADDPVDEDTECGLEFFFGVFCDVPESNEVSSDGAGHDVIVEPAEEIQPDGGPEGYEDGLGPQEKPPAQAYNYLADNKDSEGACENKQVHSPEDVFQIFPSRFVGEPDYCKKDSDGDNCDSEN